MIRHFGAALTALTILLGACASRLTSTMPSLEELGRIGGLNPSDEEQIVIVLDDVHRGMQSRKIYKVLAHVSRNYRDEDGRDYNGVEAYLSDIFKRYSEVRITRVVPRVIVQGDRAQAIETFGTVAEPRDPGSEPPINIQGQVAVSLEKVGGTWQIVAWSRVL